MKNTCSTNCPASIVFYKGRKAWISALLDVDQFEFTIDQFYIYAQKPKAKICRNH